MASSGIDVADLLMKSEEVVCRKFELVQNGVEKPRIIWGAGYLKSTSDGRLRFKIFAPEVNDIEFGLSDLFATQPGRLLGEDAYYRLTVTTGHDGIWFSDVVYPEINSLPIRSISGNIRELRRTEHLITGGDAEPFGNTVRPGSLHLQFLDDVEFPANSATTKSVSIIAGNEANSRESDSHPSKSWHLNVLRFSLFGYNFEMIRKENGFSFEATSDTLFPPHLDLRIQESLQFALGRTVFWKTSTFLSNGIVETRVRTLYDLNKKGRFLGPLVHNSPAGHTGEFFIKMFECYFSFALTGSDEWHPCSVHLHQAIAAGSSSTEGYALGLAVAVEGICKALHKEIGKPNQDEKAAISKLSKYLEDWPSTLDPNSCGRADIDRLMRRAKGAISRFKESRPLDQMIPLVQDSVIEERHVEAWKKLRNPSAHAEIPDPTKLQEHFDKQFAVNVLIHHLIFAEIGYEGWYTDYSLPNFPDRFYRLGDMGKEPVFFIRN